MYILLNTPIIFQNYAVIAQIMLLSFWLNPEGFKKLLYVGTLWYKRVLKGLLLQDTERQEFLLDVLQVLRIKFEQWALRRMETRNKWSDENGKSSSVGCFSLFRAQEV